MISATADLSSYPAHVALPGNGQKWPEAGRELLHHFSHGRAAYSLIVGPPEQAETLANRLATDLALKMARVGPDLARLETPPSANDVNVALDDATIICDLEVLMEPRLGLPLLTLLARRAHRHPTIAVWPGEVVDGYARFSRPGRPDHFERRLDNVIVLRPVATSFPDEVPYTIERGAG